MLVGYVPGHYPADDTIPKSSYTANISDADATTNLCKSVKSVSFYIYRHRLTLILPKVSVNKITDFWNSAPADLHKEGKT